jgi:hypothetical protein
MKWIEAVARTVGTKNPDVRHEHSEARRKRRHVGEMYWS